ncbi:hypothetical protein GCM10025859_64400 [Alicyclobacillus fastidiosus]|nr:hypothetical protein GCM10025859_64400 [Alicyclobacillus fastidiosus]
MHLYTTLTTGIPGHGTKSKGTMLFPSHPYHPTISGVAVDRASDVALLSLTIAGL